MTGRYARPHGLASPSSGAAATTAAVGAFPRSVGAVLALGLAAADDPQSVARRARRRIGRRPPSPALAQRRIGGFTGDTLGAAGVAETIGLLTAAAVLRP